MKVAIASSSRLAIPTIEALELRGTEIIGIITKPDAPQGRGRTLGESELAVEIAGRYPIYKPGSSQELLETVRTLNPDLVATIAYGKIVKSDVLQVPKYGWLNLHFSLLPKYRGAAPTQWAIRNGEAKTGVSVFKLDPGMDTGPIYRTAEIQLLGDETTGELLRTLSLIGADLVCDSCDLIMKGVPPKEQVGEPSYAPKITKNDARIFWTRSGDEIDRIVRSMNPDPMAWSEFRGARVRIGKVTKSTIAGAPGEILDPAALLVGTGTTALKIDLIQPEGKRMMPAAEWLRGIRLTATDRFE